MTIARAAVLTWSLLMLPGADRTTFAERQAATDPADPDELYQHRENMADAERAAALWAEHALTDYASAWKLARASYWIGTAGPSSGRHAALERGLTAAHSAAKLDPNAPEGHFWLAAVMGAIAESSGVLEGLKYRADIKSELERVIALAPDWQEGSAESALGRWYFEVPGWGFGGSRPKAEQILRGVVAKFPDNQTALSFLADVLIAEGKNKEAAALLHRAIDAPPDPDWIPEHEDFAKKAEARLRAIHEP